MLAHARVCGRRRNASRHTPSGSSQSDGRSPGLRVFACFRLPGARPVALWKQTRRLQLRGQPRLGHSPHRVPFSPSVFRPRAPSFARLETGPADLQDATARCPARKSKPLYWQLVLRSGLLPTVPTALWRPELARWAAAVGGTVWVGRHGIIIRTECQGRGNTCFWRASGLMWTLAAAAPHGIRLG